MGNFIIRKKKKPKFFLCKFETINYDKDDNIIDVSYHYMTKIIPPEATIRGRKLIINEVTNSLTLSSKQDDSDKYFTDTIVAGIDKRDFIRMRKYLIEQRDNTKFRDSYTRSKIDRELQTLEKELKDELDEITPVEIREISRQKYIGPGKKYIKNITII